MISRETFVKTMEKLIALDKKLEKIDSALRELSPDFCGFYIPDIFSIAVDLLAEDLGDTEAEWLSYFVWEKDWLREFKIGDVSVDGEPVLIYGWGDVYDFITRGGKDG